MSTGVVMVVNGHYGGALLQAAEQLVGALNLCLTEVPDQGDAQELRRRITEAVELQDQGAGVLLLTDLCGSTPANICLALLAEHQGSEIITGLNLAMLIKLSTCDRCQNPTAIAEELRKTSQRSIKLGSELIHKRGECGD